MNPQPRSCGLMRGLTLLELQLVLVLLAVTGAMAIGSLSATEQSNHRRLAESAIRELDDLGRTWARKGEGARLTTDADRVELRLLSADGDLLASRPMPQAVSIRIVSECGRAPWVWFDTTAAAPDYRVVLGDGPVRRWSFEISGLTGQLRSTEAVR